RTLGFGLAMNCVCKWRSANFIARPKPKVRGPKFSRAGILLKFVPAQGRIAQISHESRNHAAYFFAHPIKSLKIGFVQVGFVKRHVKLASQFATRALGGGQKLDEFLVSAT